MIPNDHWTLDLEKLGMRDTGDRLARLILQCRPPFAICVQGKWGSGKTSLMRYAMAALGGKPLAMTLRTSSKPREELQEELREKWDSIGEAADGLAQEVFLAGMLGNTWKDKYAQHIQVVPIWFNPWQHQQAELPLIGLLQELRAQFSHLVKFGRKARKLSEIGVEAGLSILGNLIDIYSVAQGGPKLGVGKSVQKIRGLGEAYEQRNFEGLESAQRLNILFEAAVRRLLCSENETQAVTPKGVIELRRLVVFVDDLDRCSDIQTVRLLEAIKLYLQTPYCVFVIGMDGAAARRAVERVLPHTRPEEAQEYLEKLFQARVHVPIPHRHDSFMLEILQGCSLTAAETGMEEEVLAALLARLVEPNPRKLKSFVGSLAIAWQIAHSGASVKPDANEFIYFLLVAYLRGYHPNIFRLLAHEPELAVDLNGALNEDAEQPVPESSPVRRLFRRSFRHAFNHAADTEAEAAIKELTERIDRYRGDRAFLDLWSKSFPDDPKAIPLLLAPALQVSCNDE